MNWSGHPASAAPLLQVGHGSWIGRGIGLCIRRRLNNDAFYNDDGNNGYAGTQKRKEEETVDLEGKPSAVAAPPLVTKEGNSAAHDLTRKGTETASPAMTTGWTSWSTWTLKISL